MRACFKVTQSMPKPRTCFKPSKPMATQPGGQFTHKYGRDTSALHLTGGVSEERDTAAQETPAHTLGSGSGWVKLKYPSNRDAETARMEPCSTQIKSIGAATGVRRGFGAIVGT